MPIWNGDDLERAVNLSAARQRRQVISRLGARLLARGLDNQDGGLTSPLRETLSAECFLSPSQLEYASRVMVAMVEQLEVSADNVRLLVDHSKNGRRRVVAADCSPGGQYHGSYMEIQSRRFNEPGFFYLDIDGEQVDALSSTTTSVFNAIIANALARGETWPDFPEAEPSLQWTMLLGEPLTTLGHVPVICQQGVVTTCYPDDKSYNLRIRAAVEIAVIDQVEDLPPAA